jgi:flavin reductase (DIM6/NTAB) family NADH-FMN oxidoreductase RutF
MQKDIGAVLGLYPLPVTIVGTVLGDGRANFLPIAHVGIPDMGKLMISVGSAHVLDVRAIEQNGVVSVSLVSRKMLEAADWCGIAKAEDTDKSGAFLWHRDELEKAPVIDEAPVCMTCRVQQMVPVGDFRNYILKPVHTYVQEEFLDGRGKIDYTKADPVLFEFQNTQYLSTGKVIAKCWDYGKNYR